MLRVWDFVLNLSKHKIRIKWGKIYSYSRVHLVARNLLSVLYVVISTRSKLFISTMVQQFREFWQFFLTISLFNFWRENFSVLMIAHVSTFFKLFTFEWNFDSKNSYLMKRLIHQVALRWTFPVQTNQNESEDEECGEILFSKFFKRNTVFRMKCYWFNWINVKKQFLSRRNIFFKSSKRRNVVVINFSHKNEQLSTRVRWRKSDVSQLIKKKFSHHKFHFNSSLRRDG